MLYSYQKATPDDRTPGKVVPRYLRVIPIFMSSLGLALVAAVVWPMFSYKVNYFFVTKTQESELLSPAVYESFASETSRNNNNQPVVLSEVDYTKASNWFSFSPSDLAPTSDSSASTSQSQFINLTKDNPAQEPPPLSATTYTLAIPSLGIKEANVHADSDDLAKSLVQFKQTAAPGQFGSPVIIGHSTLPQFFNPTNYLTVFATLPTINLGADIFITYAGVKYTYRINKMYEINPTDVWILRQDYSQKSLKLITCVPPGTTLRRLVVEADLIPT